VVPQRRLSTWARLSVASEHHVLVLFTADVASASRPVLGETVHRLWSILLTSQLLSSIIGECEGQQRVRAFATNATPCHICRMKTWKQFLKPDWRRLVASTLMLALLVAGYIQAFAFVDDVPNATKPSLYDALLPFDFWVPGVLLILPLAVVSAPLRWLGLSPLSSPWIWPVQILYLYLLSYLLLFGHDHCAKDIAARWRILIVILPVSVTFALWTPGILSAIRSMPRMILFFGSSTLLSGCVLALYAYTAICVGLAIRRRLPANRRSG
jgi:hypothetical protein